MTRREQNWGEKRKARGIALPLAYLGLEAFQLFLIVHIVNLLKIEWLSTLAAIGAVFYFVTSCFPRFKRVLDRQSKQNPHFRP